MKRVTASFNAAWRVVLPKLLVILPDWSRTRQISVGIASTVVDTPPEVNTSSSISTFSPFVSQWAVFERNNPSGTAVPDKRDIRGIGGMTGLRRGPASVRLTAGGISMTSSSSSGVSCSCKSSSGSFSGSSVGSEGADSVVSCGGFSSGGRSSSVSSVSSLSMPGSARTERTGFMGNAIARARTKQRNITRYLW